jgi:hypothetical protein
VRLRAAETPCRDPQDGTKDRMARKGRVTSLPARPKPARPVDLGRPWATRGVLAPGFSWRI